MLEGIAGKLKIRYPGKERQEVQVEVQTRIEGLETTTTARSAPPRRLLPTADESGLARIGPGVLSVHVLKPYPGWESFEERIQEAVTAVCEVTEASALLEVAIRYVDRIALPARDGLNLEDYFTAIPHRPSGMPGQLAAYQFITEAHDSDTGTIAVLTTSAVPPGAGEGFVMLYDLNLMRRYPQKNALPIEEYLTVLNELHEQQYKIFTDSITDETKELFT